MNRAVIASGCDAKYFDLLADLLESLSVHPQSRQFDLVVFDLGLTDAQRDQISQYGPRIIQPGWDIEVPPKIKTQPFRRAFTLVPFLPRYIPGYDVYIWLDADTWMQEWFPIEHLLQGVSEQGCAIAPEIDRNFSRPYNSARVKLALGGLHARVRTWSWTRFRRRFGLRTANQLMMLPLLNTGVFAMHADAPHWAAWAESFRAARLREPGDLCDQSMFMHAVYTRGLPFARLSALCNWCAPFDLAFDRRRGRLVEPNVPHSAIGIVHLVGNAAGTEFTLPVLEGESGEMSTRVTYRGMKSLLHRAS